MSINTKKKWLKPQLVLLSNNTVKGGTSTAQYRSEFLATSCSGTCASPTSSYPTGTNSVSAFCYSGPVSGVAICS